MALADILYVRVHIDKVIIVSSSTELLACLLVAPDQSQGASRVYDHYTTDLVS